MKYTETHEVSHREWDVVHIEAEDFFANWQLFVDQDTLEDDEATYYYDMPNPTFRFDSGKEHYAEELWFFDKERKHIRVSGFSGGLVEWEGGNYVCMSHGIERPLGQLVSVSFTKTDELVARLARAT